MEKWIQGCFMSNPEFLPIIQQLSRDEKVEMIQFLTAELTKEEGLKSLDNDVVYRLWSPLRQNSEV
ncbi:hypothetical protein [Planktothrix agardhii]|uniref:hypothetical protein n=1 Tax=Planktothrix agardhii TaxID=1160 RepID=UPI000412E59D|nr:hypothetical protein [Planktothrix agardhii]